MEFIYHITTRSQWDKAQSAGEYWPLESDGGAFIHFSFAHQVRKTADHLFSGRRGLILLEIDLTSAGSSLKIECSDSTGEKFPHLYRRLRVEDVVRVLDYPPGPDGEFPELDVGSSILKR